MILFLCLVHQLLHRDHNQSLSHDELFQACAHAGIRLSPKEGAQLVAMIDKDESGQISAAEFMKYCFIRTFQNKQIGDSD